MTRFHTHPHRAALAACLIALTLVTGACTSSDGSRTATPKAKTAGPRRKAGGGEEGEEGREAPPGKPGKTEAKAVDHDTSPPLSTITPLEDTSRRVEGEGEGDNNEERLPHPTGTRPDPVIQDSLSVNGAPVPSSPTVGASFLGVGNGFTGPAGSFSVNSAPPDTNSAVGPSHIVETVNSSFAVLNKAGTVLYGPAALNTLWSGFGGGCQTNNDGDPVVRYDRAADRWIISQFSVSTTPFLECVAVSATGDPLGAYHRYSFQYAEFPDYPKMGIWPNGYYVTYNLFNASGTSYLGARTCAMDKAKMMTGAAATQQCFTTSTSYGGLLPGDLDSSIQPPAGADNISLALGTTSTTLAYWRFHVDWTTPANTTVSGPTNIAVPAYTTACGASGTCIPQPSTTQTLDSLSDRLMNRLAYRNFGDRQALLVSHSVTAGSATGVRWYELRVNASGVPSLFQAGTFAPDATSRWMGSAAFDKVGNIGMIYSGSSTSVKPGIYVTGRLVGDAAGTMTQGETTLQAGGGSQNSSGLSRWGDYASVTVDPVDDCTMWSSTEYLPANGSFNWATRINSFTLPNCTNQSKLSGTVKDTNGVPIKGVLVEVPGYPAATTDAAGAYSVTGFVANGSYTVGAEGVCRAPVSQPVTVAGDTVANFTLGAFVTACSTEAQSWDTTSTALPLTTTDTSTTVTLPFGYKHLGVTYNSAYISSNGFVNFLGPDTTSANTAIPNAVAPNAALYGFWDHIKLDGSSAVLADVIGTGPDRRYTIEYRNVSLVDDPTLRFSFQISLYEDPTKRARLQYKGITPGTSANGSSATVGDENAAGNGANVVSFNRGLLYDGLTVRPK